MNNEVLSLLHPSPFLACRTAEADGICDYIHCLKLPTTNISSNRTQWLKKYWIPYIWRTTCDFCICTVCSSVCIRTCISRLKSWVTAAVATIFFRVTKEYSESLKTQRSLHTQSKVTESETIQCVVFRSTLRKPGIPRLSHNLRDT